MRISSSRSFVLSLALLAGNSAAAFAEEGKVVLVSKAPFPKVAAALEQAIADQKMGLVCHANAQQGAAARGVKIPVLPGFCIDRFLVTQAQYAATRYPAGADR